MLRYRQRCSGDNILSNDATFEAVWTDLTKIYSVRNKERPWYTPRATEDDLQRWARQTGMSDKELMDQIAVRVARGFYNREFDFTFCACVIGDLQALDIKRSCQLKLFWQIWLAFDAGEFYRLDASGEVKRDEDPGEVYTRPLIAELLAKNSTFSAGKSALFETCVDVGRRRETKKWRRG